VQAHTLGEVGILGIVLLRVSSVTNLPIFTEIGSYLTDKEQKNKFAQFFRHGVQYIVIVSGTCSQWSASYYRSVVTRQTTIKLPRVTDHAGGSIMIEHSLQLISNGPRRYSMECVAVVDA